jgi:hypothetical protein
MHSLLGTFDFNIEPRITTGDRVPELVGAVYHNHPNSYSLHT